MRRLETRWRAGTNWPQRLEWIEIAGIRGWTGQKFELRFPIMAIVGENGVGKSTVLQAAASVYRNPVAGEPDNYASDFFPSTAWEEVTGVDIGFSYRNGAESKNGLVRKPTSRWLRNPDRPQRHVAYIDLSRILPISARVGYKRLANEQFTEERFEAFDKTQVTRTSQIMGRDYGAAKISYVDAEARPVPVLVQGGHSYSGFHQGAGETTIAELLRMKIPRYSLVLIDEIESSLHPRAQRRLMRDLAARCVENEWQILLTTHSPYVLEELPEEARAQITQTPDGHRSIMYGVSPQFAMTHMDDRHHPEVDIYVEDLRAMRFLMEILAEKQPDLLRRITIVPFGGATVGKSLGVMVAERRFPRPTVVYLDGDMPEATGCSLLPGSEAPERVVFESLATIDWAEVAARISRQPSRVVDELTRAMTEPDHHRWVNDAADRLDVGGDVLWQSLCSEWAKRLLNDDEVSQVTTPITDAIDGIQAPRRVPSDQPLGQGELFGANFGSSL
jgi:predicted ATPase